MQSVGDVLRERDVLAGEGNAGGRDVGLELCGIQLARSPVVTRLAADRRILGGGLVAVVPQVDLV